MNKEVPIPHSLVPHLPHLPTQESPVRLFIVTGVCGDRSSPSSPYSPIPNPRSSEEKPMTSTREQLINKFCEISLIVAISIQKTNKLPNDALLLEEESQIRRLAWDNQIAPDELHLAALRYKKANGIDITDAQIYDHIAKMRSWQQEKQISERRQRIEAEMFERIRLGA